MCGICGIIDYTNKSIAEESIIRKMCAELKHRGPDDEGVYLNNKSPSVGLGHRRLSIIDLSSAGRQPMPNEDKTVWLIFNGEVYNYKELKPELEKKGHKFSSDTDTETVIHLYEEYGEDCLKHIRGMFAFALWDDKKQIFFAARDRAGKKPFIYSNHNGRFCFASEFTALLASGFIEKEINLEAIDYYLTFGYIPAPMTIYKGVFKLPPAHFLLFKGGELKIKRYWELDYSQKINISEEDAAGEILRLLKEATKIRLYSDVPLGAFLSGGIDSSAVVALMAELSSQRIKTFSIGFQEQDYNELTYAKNISSRFYTEHHEFIVRPDALEVLPVLVERYGEPYADSSCIPSYYVAKYTKEHVTVALNGDGGDESFAGYERYLGILLSQVYQKMPEIARHLITAFTDKFPDLANSKNIIGTAKRFFAATSLPVRERYLHWVSIFSDELKLTMYSADFKYVARDISAASLFNPYFENYEKLSMLDVLLMTDVHTYLPDDLLVKMDIVSMANSLEARSPFLDNKVMEFAAKLPPRYKIRGLVKKYILRKSLKGLVPSENLNRKKMGFGAPVGLWFRGELRNLLRDTLLSKSALGRGYFDTGAIKKIIEQHLSGHKDYKMQLWALLMLELWHKRFID
jgi:asparagine synthase (glutamine-hydrolysing)